MTKNGMAVILEAARKVQANHPEVFGPLSRFFNVDIDERLNNPQHWEHLCY
jgi:4-hydroxy-tetrahydrodipicolinate synthase